MDFGRQTAFNVLLIQEYIPLGQCVKSFTVEAFSNGKWNSLGRYGAIGYKRILELPEILSDKVRLTINDARGCLALSNLQLFHAPSTVDNPVIARDKEGMVKINNKDKGPTYYYTLDGSMPTTNSKKYKGPFEALEPVLVSAIPCDSTNNRLSDPTILQLDIAKKMWKMIGHNTSYVDDTTIDDNIWTNYELSPKEIEYGLIIDLGEKQNLKGFTYTPDQSRWPSGIITHYDCYVSTNGNTWSLVIDGEFSNITNNPIKQTVRFIKPIKGRFIKLRAKGENTGQKIVVAQFGVITK
ncbi:discoidin domain-containing protein [Muricauda sp. SCSIO 64092]|uniref:discoidin domain-containing protein n=1 Tax=Allomuricauda sp. SCSIO 64092 TaxID=2908842 RepID=UPI001FF5BCF7|nr:discoidin domain-containing protein [Muricauda sp. SCSIO 64092]UOY04889.1 discoidin domain-containing protein [Muricauda sp. SCSIO 64092]